MLVFCPFSPFGLPHPRADSALAFFLASALITVARIALRVQKRMFWWDDFWAVVALACFTTFVPGEILQLLPCSHPSNSCPGVFIIADGPLHPQPTRVAGYYMGKFQPSPLLFPSAHACTERSRWILLLHCLGCSAFHHLHCCAHRPMGLPEEGYVGYRSCHLPPMGPLDGSNVLGL